MALFTASCATDAVTGKSTYNYYTLQDDVQLGQQTLAENRKQMEEAGVPINQDAKMVATLNTIVERIAAVSDLPQLPYTVTLFHTNIVNAAAAPGGSMIVFEGLYSGEKAMVKNGDLDEIAAVMAHEIAHVTCRHVTERLTKVMSAAVTTELIAAILVNNDEGDWATGIRAAFAVGTPLLIPSYTRRDEAEADRVGLFYMARAGYDPRAAPRIWKRVADEKGDYDSASIFATHPSNWDRYEELQKLVPYAMREYAKSVGRYPKDYTPPPDFENVPDENWRAR